MNEKKSQKKIETKIETKNSWKFLIGISLFLIVILAGTLGVAYYNKMKSEELKQENMYNGFEFVKSGDGFWITQLTANNKPYFMPFYYHPREVLNVTLYPNVAKGFIYPNVRPKLIYISLNPDHGSKPVIAGVEISRLLGEKYNLFNYKVKSALTKPQEGTDTLVKTCKDATPGIVVIQFEEAANNQIFLDGNCVHFQYTDPEESIRVADRLDYALLQII